MHEQVDTDVLIIGSGAAGMAAAICVKSMGLECLVIEKADVVGGTSALTQGGVWIPGNSDSRRRMMQDSREDVMRYLRAMIGDAADEAMLAAYLDNGPEAIDYIEAHSQMKLVARTFSPDYQPSLPGGALGCRALDPVEFDGRRLGKSFDLLRRPLSWYMIFGGMMVNLQDINALRRPKSPKLLLHAISILVRYAVDRLKYSRGTRLLMGNALAASLFKSVIDLKIPLWRNATAVGLHKDGSTIVGADVETGGQVRRVNARRGVVLATGGFPSNKALREKYLPAPTEPEWTMAPPTNTGDGINMGTTAGGTMGRTNIDNAFWTPVSTFTDTDGSVTKWHHAVLDRQKPGLIAVNSSGRRFTNEGHSYHDFARAMYMTGSVPAYLICDARFVRKYGFGLIHPGFSRRRPYIKSGYLVEARSITDLAGKLGLDASALEAQVERNNHFARTGVDEEFDKGSTAYNRLYGDPDNKPNPCLGPIATAPYYAIRVVPGDLGTSLGLQTNVNGQVVNEQGQPIPQLYACGNDMNSVMSGAYPGPGITLGPALTFAYIVARHIAGGTKA